MSRKRLSLPSDLVAIHLQQMLDSILEIESYVKGMDLASYRADRTKTLVVERLLQILTEAAFRLGRDAETLCPGINWRSVRDLGNFLRHAYDRIDSAIIWNAITKEMPPLKESVQKALASLNSISADQSV